MDYAYEEDLQIAVASIKKEQSTLEIDKLIQLWNRLEKKVDDMVAAWQTEQSVTEIKEIQKSFEKVNVNELYTLVENIQGIDVRYDFDMLQMN